MSVIEFDGGVLRPFGASDAPSIARHGNDREIWLNLRDRFPHPYREGHATAYIDFLASLSVQHTWAIDVDGAAVGSISLMPREDVERISTEIGYWLGRELWGRGIMTAAVRALTAHALAKLDFMRVFATPFASNVASIRLLEKAGYTKEGVMRRAAIKDGQVIDMCLYAAYRES